MFQIYHTLLKSSKLGRIPAVIRLNKLSSTTQTVELKKLSINSSENDDDPNLKAVHSNKPSVHSKSNNTMVAAAFASLHSNSPTIDIKTPFTDEKIIKATTVNELLSVSEGSGVSRRHALKVVSILADWSSLDKVKLADFETDPRFLRLCRILTKGANSKVTRNPVLSKSEDLSTILNITADDEAAKLVASISLPQMVKVMSTLSQKKRRSTLLLRALTYNITRSPERLNLKESSDLLYSMSSLNFPDETLLTRIGNDICLELEGGVKKSAVVGSIITSMGLLKYKNIGLLDALSEWILNNHAICRPQDIFSLFMTLAILNFIPTNSEKLFQEIIPQLTASEAGKPVVWLEVVWSLVLLRQANAEHVSSVLCNDFLDQLGGNFLTSSSKLKLLNIDGAAKYLIKGYNGPRLPSSIVRDTQIAQTKDKSEMVENVLTTLKNLIQSEHHLRTRINTGFGFFVDAECVLDQKCSPLPLNQSDIKPGVVKVAILANDYHDMTRGRVEPTGINVLASSLLEAQGYKVLVVPYTEFKPRDKLVYRVQYLESKLKEIVKTQK